MKRFVLSVLVLTILALAGCSRSEEKTTVKPQSTPDAARLRADAERLQQATANAAKQREQAAQAANPTPTP